METATGVLYGAVLFVRGYGKPAAEPMAMEKGKKAIFMKQVFTNGRKQELAKLVVLGILAGGTGHSW